MFFTLSKLLAFLVDPLWWILILLALALALSLLRRHRLARTALVIALIVLVVGAFTTLGAVLIQPLEARFAPPPAPPAEVAGIIVLGGGMSPAINAVRGGYELNRSGDRFVEALRLARLHPQARLLISGGSGALLPGSDSEAAAGARFFTALGVAPERLVLEDRSRNTAENARYSRALLDPQLGEVWLLVTSAFHMPRAVGLFRRAGFDIVPWPADYLTTGTEAFAPSLDQPAENLAILSTAIREWAGLLVYRATDRIDELLPAPE